MSGLAQTDMNNIPSVSNCVTKFMDVTRKPTESQHDEIFMANLNEAGASTSRKERSKAKPGPGKYKFRKGKQVLWQFILQLLKESDDTASVVKWENRTEGVFRITDSRALAHLWDKKKQRKTLMNYEKLSRAMRGYYKDKILFAGPKTGLYPKKLVYQFGPNATGWKDVAKSQGALHKLRDTI